jgi:hypothetical protein
LTKPLRLLIFIFALQGPNAIHAEDFSCDSVVGVWAEIKNAPTLKAHEQFTEIYIHIKKQKDRYDFWLMVGPDLFTYKNIICRPHGKNEIRFNENTKSKSGKFAFRSVNSETIFLIKPENLRYDKNSQFLRVKPEWTFIPKNIMQPQ